jgi:renalase
MADGCGGRGRGLAGLVAARGWRRAGPGDRVREEPRPRRAARHPAERAGELRPRGAVVHCEPWQVAPLEARGACLRWGDLGHVGLPGMSGLVRPLAEGLDLRPRRRSPRSSGAGGRASCASSRARRRGPFARVVLAVPAPQAARIAAGLAGAEALTGVGMGPVWTLMAAFAERPDLPDMLRPGGAIDLVVRDAAKPGPVGRGLGRPCHRTAGRGSGWSCRRKPCCRCCWPSSRTWPRGGCRARPCGGAPLAVRADRARARGALRRAGGGAVLAGGDWALGPRGEHAWLSGQAMAEAVLG